MEKKNFQPSKWNMLQENRFADVLAVLGSQIMFEGDNTRVEVSKREESIIEMLKERFQEE